MAAELIASKSQADLSERIRQFLRRGMPSPVYAMGSRILDAAFAIKHIGLLGYWRVWRVNRSRSTSLLQISISSLLHPIWIRPGTSDLEELLYSTARQAYNTHVPKDRVRTIVDAGANLGDTAAWYLSRFPKAKVIAIEPDPANFAILKMNMEPYGDRCELIEAALWSEPGELWLQAESEHNAVSVTGTKTTGLRCRAMTMKEILHQYAPSEIDIFKCDVEGAEWQIFSQGDLSWIRQLRSAVVEIHDERSLKAVTDAFAALNCHPRIHRNLHFFLC